MTMTKNINIIFIDLIKECFDFKTVLKFMGVSAVVNLCSFHLASAQADERPNVLFILVDDLGYHDLGITGSEFYETPAIDMLGESSFRFSQGYAASPVCSPARASIMTGMTPAKHGITDWIGAPSGENWRKQGRHTRLLPPEYHHQLADSALTLPELLKSQGYQTFFAGKWHLGGEGSYPEDHGFDINIGGWESGSPRDGYFAPYRNPKLAQGPDGENLSLRLAKETAGFLKQQHEKPFFAMLSFYAVHGPIQTTEVKWKKYRDKAEKSGIEETGYAVERRLPIRQVQDNPVYAGLVESMDEAIAHVLATLEATGLDKNTIVIFTSDHGGVSSGDSFSTSNLPLRGGKGYQWEGGLRVPYFIRVPGMEGNDIVDYPVNGIDFYPTIAEMVGAELMPNASIEGVSLWPLIKGEELERRDLFWHYPHYSNQGGDPCSIIRSGKWKLIHYWEDQSVELYDLETDPYEQQDMAGTEKELSDELKKRLMTWLEINEANKPKIDPEYDVEKEGEYLQRMKTEVLSRLEKDRKNMLTKDWKPNADWWGSKLVKD